MGTTAMIKLIINVILLAAGVVLLLIAALMNILKLTSVKRLVLLAVYIVSCSLWFLVRDPILGISTTNNPFFEFFEVFTKYWIVFMTLSYMVEFTHDWRKEAIVKCRTWAAIFAILSAVIPLFTSLRFRDFDFTGGLCNIVFFVIMLFCVMWESFREKDKQAFRFVLSASPVLLGGVLEVLNFICGYPLTENIVYFTGFVIFIMVQIFTYV